MTHRFPQLVGVLTIAVLVTVSSLCHGQMNAEIQRQAAKNPLLNDYYKARNFNPVWGPGHLSGLSTFLRSLEAHGLSPNLFQLDVWEPHWLNPSPDPKVQAGVEVSTTHLALYAIQALAYGFVDPTEVHPKWKPIKRAVTASQFLDAAFQQPVSQFAPYLLEKVPPPDSRYRDMVKTLERYRKIQSFGGWKPLPDPGRPVGPGISYQDLDLLKARLQAEGDLPNTPQAKNRKKIFEQLTSDALKSFQFRHGITPDGYIGPNTLKEINIPTAARINTLIINLDRIRWMPRAYEQSEHVEVNIAESALRVYNNRKRVTTMEVIVGVKGKHQTPVFHGDIKYLIFRPYWNVPNTIARVELIPEALKDLTYMERNKYEIVPFFGVSPDKALPVTVENLNKVSSGALQMRQATGPGNALGLVKFIFPNDNSVYLHDTPNHNLFKQADRDLSHGCVRVSRPDELAQIILQRNDGNWNINAVRSAMDDASNPDNKVNLNNPLPVYLMYWTSFIMGDGRVRFDEDIYGHDVVMKQRFGLR
ncbi:MAG: L,D-transpeptidase family protein [Verrucomicrobiales bacterium]|nr:L,D-transpeptidase family protein [Verrucomicrobiales bacterium]